MDLRVFLKLDGSGFQQGLTSAKHSVKQFGEQAFGGLKEEIFAAFTAGAIIEMSKKTIEWAGHVQDLSDRLGVSVEYLQQMQYVAKRSGSSVDTLAGFFEKLAINRQEALAGNQDSAKKLASFEKLGVSAQTLSSTGTQGLTDIIADAFKNGGSSEALIGALRDVGGRGAGELIASFTHGLAEGRQAAVDAGAVMSEDTVDALKEIDDEFEELKIQLMVNLGPAILTVVSWLKNLWDVFKAGAAAVQGFMEVFSFKKLFSGQAEREQNMADAKKEAADRSDAVMQESIDDQLRNEKEARERSAARHARQRGDIIPIQTYKPKEHEEKKVTDSLISVGNFLGAGRSTLESIGIETNNLLRESREYLRQIANKTANTTPNSGMQVPAT